MEEAVTQARPAYVKPGLEQLGSFAALTLGNKWQTFGDMSNGHGGSGPGS